MRLRGWSSGSLAIAISGDETLRSQHGAWLTMESVRQIRIAKDERTLGKLIDLTLAAPDIDADVFLQQLRVVGRLRSPVTVLVSKKDQALSISRFIAGGQFRAGAAILMTPEFSSRRGIQTSA